MAASILDLASMYSPTNLLNKTGSAKAAAATANGTSTTGTSTSGNSGLDGTTTGQTFLNLLVKELQNQDPTAPMDSTAMVGQMISLNQLDQLISINQVLSAATTSTSTSTPTKGGTAHTVSATPAMSSAAQIAQRASLLQNGQNSNAIQAAMQSAADPTKALDLSSLNIQNGGK